MTSLESTMKTEKPNIVMGYTTRKHLLLDLDNTVLSKVVLLVSLIQEYKKKVGDCLIVLSSMGSHRQRIRYSRLGRPLVVRELNNYHLVFDATIGYNSCCHIISTLAGLYILNRDYLKIRTFRGDMTLRVSPCIQLNRSKPVPQPVYYCQSKHPYERGGNIDKYLSMLKDAHAIFTKEIYYLSLRQLYQLQHQSLHISHQLQLRNTDRLCHKQ